MPVRTSSVVSGSASNLAGALYAQRLGASRQNVGVGGVVTSGGPLAQPLDTPAVTDYGLHGVKWRFSYTPSGHGIPHSSESAPGLGRQRTA
jgi:hypothetical protein